MKSLDSTPIMFVPALSDHFWLALEIVLKLCPTVETVAQLMLSSVVADKSRVSNSWWSLVLKHRKPTDWKLEP
jgi:hypothetical protein